MLRQVLNFTIQNKNFVMFITAIIYIMGVFAYFTNLAIPLCIILSACAIIGIVKNIISPKLVIFWIFVFYFAFFNCNFRIKNSDDLAELAPQKNFTLSGQIVSIPNSNFSDKSKFFFQTDKGKTLVSVTSKDEDFSRKSGTTTKLQGN